MKKRIKFFIIFFLFVLSCLLHTKSMATVDCTCVQDSDVMYVNSTLTNINLEEYNANQRNLDTEVYYSKSWLERYNIDKNFVLFGSWNSNSNGGVQNGCYNEHVFGSYFGVVQGLAKDKLENGNLVIADKYNNSINLFPDSNTNSNIYQEVLSNWKFPFLKEKSGYYSFDSNNYHIYKDYNTNTFKLHEGGKYGFFPFNECQDDTYQVDNRELAFTLKMEIPFTMASDGKIINKETNEKEDMIFNFSGDDDVWVYVDDNLILDLGGCHEKTSGSINFSKNQVYYESIYHVENDQNEKDVYKTALKNGILSQGEHTLKVFYIERSGNNANLSISFNLQQGSVETQHIDIDTNRVLNTEKQEKNLGEIVTTNAKNIEGYTLVRKPENETFKILQDEQIAKYYYAKNTTVTARYIDEVTNNEISDMVVIHGKSGDKYEVTTKAIEGYDFTKVEGLPSGIMKGETINIIFYYCQRPKFNLQIEMNLSKAYINGYYFGLHNKVGKIETDIRDTNKTDSVEIYYTIQVTNNGKEEGSGYITFTIPDGFSIKSTDWIVSGNLAKYNVTNLNIGETREYQVVLQKNKGIDKFGDFKVYVRIDSDKLQETTLEDNEDMNELAIMPRTGGQVFNVMPLVLLLIVIAILLVTIINHKKVLKNNLSK